jgi:hypothetical protein
MVRSKEILLKIHKKFGYVLDTHDKFIFDNSMDEY